MTPIFAWFRAHDMVLWWLGVLSLVTFVASLILLPWLVVRLPADYFIRDRLPRHHLPQHVVLRVSGRIAKNLCGLILVIAGLIMLVLPGQGVLTILIGLTLMNFPGKHTLERRIVQQPAVLRAINWIRTQAHRPALQMPDAQSAASVPREKG